MRLLLSLNCALFVSAAALRAETPGTDLDQFEDKAVARATERAVKAKTAGQWQRERIEFNTKGVSPAFAPADKLEIRNVYVREIK